MANPAQAGHAPGPRPGTPRRHAAPGPVPAARRMVPALVQAAIWGGGAAVLGLWWRHTPAVVGAADWLTGAGRLFGLLAGYACAILVLLMARIPVLDHVIGTDRLARWHATAGRFTIAFIVAHAFFITWGYAETDHRGLVPEGVTIIRDYPEMLKTGLAFLLFLVTAVVSARFARRHMRYETWHLLHLATYAAIFLAFSHQLALGAEFVGNRAAQAAWYGLYGCAAGAVLWYRFLTPIRFSLRHRLRVTAVRPEAPGVVSVYLTGERLDELTAQPDQFFRWRFLAPKLWWAANPYSLSAPPDGRHLRITVKALGGHSAALARLAPGTRVLAEGPYGGLTAERARSAKSLLLAGGVGITPLRALFETLPGDVVLVYWARTAHDLALRGELDAIAAARGARVLYSVDEPAGYHLPLTTRTLARMVPDVAERDVFLCGPPGMTDAARAAVRDAGVRSDRIHYESFAL
ncbi:ferredoxin reductase family protein [Uniformispora flossi]|uniref:ferredoxin reductase family protein n=1 Tax=Uniformispora flossi TaxID=3390723 RepID=UPI003C2CE123